MPSSTATTRMTLLTTLLAILFISQILLPFVAADPIPVPAPEAAPEPAPAPEPEPKKGGGGAVAGSHNNGGGAPMDGAVVIMMAVGTSVFTVLASRLF